jgi:hypothetical protein
MMIGFLGLQKTYDIMKNSVKSAKTRRVGSQNKNIIRAQKDYSPEAILHKLGNGVKSALEMVGKSLQKTLNKNADFARAQKDCREVILNALKNVLKSIFWLFGISSAKTAPNAFNNDKARHMWLERVDLTSWINACLQGICPFGRIISDNTKHIPKPINIQTRYIGSQNKNIDFVWAQKDYPFKRVISDNLDSNAKPKFELFNTPNAKNKANGHDRVLITKFVKTSLLKNVCWKRQASALKNSVKAVFNLFDNAADKDKRFLGLQKTRDALKDSVKSAPNAFSKARPYAAKKHL